MDITIKEEQYNKLCGLAKECVAVAEKEGFHELKDAMGKWVVALVEIRFPGYSSQKADEAKSKIRVTGAKFNTLVSNSNFYQRRIARKAQISESSLSIWKKTGCSLREYETVEKAISDLKAEGELTIDDIAREQEERRVALETLMRNKNIKYEIVAAKLNMSYKSFMSILKAPSLEMFELIRTATCEITKEKPSRKEATTKERKHIIPPKPEWVKEFCESRKNEVNYLQFMSYYESKDWMIGKNKMKNWQAAVITWEQNRKKWA